MQPPAPEVPFAVPVFFATNRRGTTPAGAEQDYGSDPGEEPKFPRIPGGDRAFTSYASKSDRALLVSAGLHRMSRVGFIKDEPFVTDGLVTVDASAVDTGLLGLGHGYVYGKRSVLTDVGLLLREGLPAARRGLREVSLRREPAKRYWSFPP
jgi:esterase/lipase superfamily enzyme